VAEVEHQRLVFFFLRLEEVIARDSAMEVQELVGYVGHDGGPAGRDAAFGGEDQEAGEKLADVEAVYTLR